MSEDHGVPGPLRWPQLPSSERIRIPVGARYSYLLDEDSDLAEELAPPAREAIRRSTAVAVLEAEPGEHTLERWLGGGADGLGLLVLDGVIAFETHVGDRTAAELIGAGDLIQTPHHRAEEMLLQIDSWRVLVRARLALLDATFTARVSTRPQLVRALLRRAGRRVCEVDALRAIASHPRLEMRLVMLLWHLAARWGRVEPAGIRLQLPLTHRLLGQLVAAERPSVSHALTRLTNGGLISGATCDLHLHGTLDRQLEALNGRVGHCVSPRPSAGSTLRVSVP